MLCEGIGIRATSRLTGLDQQTVLRILASAGEHCARLLDAKIRNLHVAQLQTDEIWCFVHCKAAKVTPLDMEWGDQYTYLTFDRDSKLIVNHFIGKRTGENCEIVMRDLRARIDGQFQLSTDAFLGYANRNGGAVFRVFGNAAHFGTIHKIYGKDVFERRRYSPAKCLYVKKVAQIGNPDPKMICTSHVERQNLNVRLFNRRFTRLTMGFSKKLEYLKYSVALTVAYHNFCRVHTTLKTTPAQAAGLTDHAWTIAELLESAN
jgi:IS1 family transposase